MDNLQSLARTLNNFNIIDLNKVERVEKIASKNNSIGDFFEQCLEEKLYSGKEVARQMSANFGIPQIDLLALNKSDLPRESIDLESARKNYTLPIHEHNDNLYVAVADPTNKQAIDDIKFRSNSSVTILIANPEDFTKILDHLDTTAEDSILAEVGGAEGALLDDINIGGDNDEDENSKAEEAIDDAPLVRYVNKILLDAIKKGASDIHIEPFEKFVRIRLRIDGVLHETAKQPISLANRIAARIKIIAKLDISERRAPQDGRMQLKLSKKKTIDFRVNTLPTMYGEKVVIRILSMGSEGLTLETLGFTNEQKKLYSEAVQRPYGMVLITGPTGSGKTVTLYTALGMLNTDDKNLSTVEDPVEINMEGVNQVNINERANLTFAAALRAFLRQDPDIIMVGEIRDLETAEIAIKAAQTGHLVMSTLHTNDAPATLTRLLNMGVPAFNIASSVHLIVAQRLARRLCSKCKIPQELPKNSLLEIGFNENELEDLNIFTAKGCNNCSNGYKGRAGIFQVLPLTDEFKSLILKGCSQKDIEDLAEKNGIMDLRSAGLEKVKKGITSIEEIERITNQ